jgi:hypothetical protein
MDLGAITLTADSVLDTGTAATSIMNVGAVTSGANALTLDSGADAAADITVASFAGGGDLTVRDSGGTTFSGAVNAGTVTLTDTTGTVAFAGNTTINTGLSTANQNYNVAFTGASNSVAGDTNFLNTGTVTLGDQDTDSITFAGGLAATGNASNPGTVNIAGSVLTTDARMDLGAITLTADTVLDTGTAATSIMNVGAVTSGANALTLDSGADAAADITVASFSGGGNLTVRDSGGTTFSGAVNAGTVTLTDTTGTVAFAGNTTINTGLSTANQNYSVAFTGASNSVAGDTNFLNTGTVTLGDQDTDSITFAGGLATTGNASNPGTVNIAGSVLTADARMDLGAVTLTADSVLDTGTAATSIMNVGAVTSGANALTLDSGADAAADITVASFSGGGDLTVRDSGGTTFSGVVNAGTVTLTDTTGMVAFAGNTTINTGLSTANQNYSVAFTGASNSVAGDTNFLNTGTVTLGDQDTDSITFAGGLATTGNASNPGTVNIAGSVLTTDARMDLGAVTLTADSVLDTGTAATSLLNVGAVTSGGNALTLDSGANATADITVASFAGGGDLTVRDSGGTTFSGAVNAGTVTLTGTTGSIDFDGAVTITTLTTAAQNYALEFNAGGVITNDVILLNTGGITIGDGASDSMTFTGGLDTTAGTANLFGTIRSGGAQMDFAAVNLEGTTVIDSTNNGGAAAGADINFNDTLNGAAALTVNAGTGGDLLFGAAVGGGAALSSLVIATARDVDFDSTLETTGDFTQSTGSGTTTFDNTVTAGGDVDISNNAITFNGAGNIVSNSGAGAVELTASAGAITGGTAVSDITAGTLLLSAGSSIATALNPLLITANNLEGGAAGDVYITGASGGLTIGGAGAGVTGLSTTAGDIQVLADGPLTVDENVVNSGGGSILLAALGSSAADDLTVNAEVTASGGNGDITLVAGGTVGIDAAATVSAAGSGDVTARAGEDWSDASADQDGHAAGSITMGDGAVIRSAGGDITLDARGAVAVSTVNADSDDDGTAGNIAVNARGLSITDSSTAETANFIANILTLDSYSGIGAFGASGDIDTTVTSLDASVSGSGGIYINETGGVTLADIDTADGDIVVSAAGHIAAADINASGSGRNVTLTTSAGGLALTSVYSEGDITVTADAGDITAGAVVAGAAGTVSITASSGAIDGLSRDGTADITASTVSLDAGAGGIGASTVLEVAASATLNASTVSGDQGDIIIDSIGDLKAGLVDAGGGDVTIYSTGAIDSVSDDAVADISGGTIILTALAGGIGTSSGLDVTASGSVSAATAADNSDINIDGVGDLRLGLINAGTGDAVLRSTAGIVDANGPSNNVSARTLALTAASGVGSADSLETAVDAVTAVNTSGGNIGMVNSRSLDILAGGVTNTAGDIALSVTGELTLTGGVLSSGSQSLTASGSILGNNLSGLKDITSGGVVTLEAGSGTIGLPGTPVDIDISGWLRIRIGGQNGGVSGNFNSTVSPGILFLTLPPGLVLLNSFPNGGRTINQYTQSISVSVPEVMVERENRELIMDGGVYLSGYPSPRGLAGHISVSGDDPEDDDVPPLVRNYLMLRPLLPKSAALPPELVLK